MRGAAEDRAKGSAQGGEQPYNPPEPYLEPADILRALEAIEARADRNGYVRARRMKRRLLQHFSVLGIDRELFRGDASALTACMQTGGIQFHAGSIRGVLPQLPHPDNA